jgi:exodeoxyribonuclease VII large subunit
LQNAAQRLDELESRCRRALRQSIQAVMARTKLIDQGLRALSPLATLDRGYAIVCRAEDGALVTRSDAVAAGARIDIRLGAGGLAATVTATQPPEKEPADTD